MGGALQAGNLMVAQQAFSAMQQSWQQMESNGAGGVNGPAVPSITSGLNVAA
jgi:hypothetical protein